MIAYHRPRFIRITLLLLSFKTFPTPVLFSTLTSHKIMTSLSSYFRLPISPHIHINFALCLQSRLPSLSLNVLKLQTSSYLLLFFRLNSPKIFYLRTVASSTTAPKRVTKFALVTSAKHGFCLKRKLKLLQARCRIQVMNDTTYSHSKHNLPIEAFTQITSR